MGFAVFPNLFGEPALLTEGCSTESILEITSPTPFSLLAFEKLSLNFDFGSPRVRPLLKPGIPKSGDCSNSIPFWYRLPPGKYPIFVPPGPYKFRDSPS